MTVTTKTIGRLPLNKGDWDPNYVNPKTGLDGYGLKFRAIRYGCEVESKMENNTYDPFAWDGDETFTLDDAHWRLISGNPKVWAAGNPKPATTGTTGDYPYNGMGRVVLKKNMVGGVNTLTQDMFYKGEVGSRVPNENTIFIIQYDFVLGENITIPAGCVLEFDGGSISGSYTITGSITCIKAGLVKIFGTDLTFAGTWIAAETYPEWFGAVGDGVTDDTLSLQKTFNLGCKCILKDSAVYKTTDMLVLHNSLYGKKSKISSTLADVDPVNYCGYVALRIENKNNFVIDGIVIESNAMGLVVAGCSDFTVSNMEFRTTKFGLSLSYYNSAWCERFIIKNIHFNQPDNVNSDGIHFDGGCRYGSVENIDGFTYDDLIALNSNEYWTENGQIFQQNKTIHDISFVNCVNDETSLCALRFYGRGADEKIYNIKFLNCKFNAASNFVPAVRFSPEPEFQSSTYTMYISNIVFENCEINVFSGTNPTCGLFFTQTIGDVTFNNCKLNPNVGKYTSAMIEGGQLNININNSWSASWQMWYWGQKPSGNHKLTFKDSTVAFVNNSGIFVAADNVGASNASYNVTFINCRRYIDTLVTNKAYKWCGFGGLDYNANLKLNVSAINCPYIVVWNTTTLESNTHIDHCDGAFIQYHDDTPGRITINASLLDTLYYGSDKVVNLSFGPNNQTQSSYCGDSVFTYGLPASPKVNDFWYDVAYGAVKRISKNSNEVHDRISCTTTERNAVVGRRVGDSIYDKDLGKEVVWNGTAWVNVDGTPLA